MNDTPNPVGRPSKKDEETVKKLEEAFKDGANITEACRVAQITRETYYTWLEEDNEFSDKMSNAQEYPDVIAKMNLVSALKAKDIETSKWWAERRMKNEFSTKTETALSFEDVIKKADQYVK